MVTLMANPLSNWHLPVSRRWLIGGGRSANESRSTQDWMIKDSDKFGEFWNDTKTSLLGIRGS
jgi:hypothetical protein